MGFSADKFLFQSLEKREEQNAFRKLFTQNQLIDFCSNDYLGFASSSVFRNNILAEYKSLPEQKNGSTGSRLLAGNSEYVENLEKRIALFHNTDAGLIYNSGYDANVGLFSAVLQKGDSVIYDELIHASVHDGISLSSASAYPFKHNDTDHLEDRLKIMQGTIYVAVESIYSMDGDDAPLQKIVALCIKYNANLIVDEAHATGITSNTGKGRVQELNLENNVFARVHTFGKALGCHGAIVLGSDLLRNFLINFSRSFIYTTALPVKSLVAINQSYQLLQESNAQISKLQDLIACFKKGVSENKLIRLIQSDSPIQCIIVSGNDKVKALATALQKEGFDVRPILSPTVAKGKERLRICIHVFNTTEQIGKLTGTIKSFFFNVQD